MPPPNFPPFNQTQPRQLIRWLDVNFQGGQLFRTQAFIKIPSFTLDANFDQVSDIIGAYWYLSPNSVSLEGVDTILDEIGYVLCVMFIDEEGVHRYQLNEDSRAVLPDFERYTNQVIKKNFRIEIWSCDVSLTSVVPEIKIYTSMYGNVDYRYGNDFALVAPLAIQTNFLSNLNLPLNFPNQLYTNT